MVIIRDPDEGWVNSGAFLAWITEIYPGDMGCTARVLEYFDLPEIC